MIQNLGEPPVRECGIGMFGKNRISQFISLIGIGKSDRQWDSHRGSADDAPILRAVGDKGAQFFKQSFELKIKGDMVPESAVESIIGELQDLFARHGAGAALSAKAVFKPTKDFHTARHTLFTAEQNLEIDKVVPVSASVKTKLGRGGSYED